VSVGGLLRLHVTVTLRGEIIEDTVLRVVDGVRLGEHEDAVVGFPGLDLVLRLHEDTVVIRGRALRDGDRMEVGVEDVLVRFQALAPRLGREQFRVGLGASRIDLALPLLLASLILISLSAATLRGVLDRQPEVSRSLAGGVTKTIEALLLPAELRDIPGRPPVVGEPIQTPTVRYVDYVHE